VPRQLQIFAMLVRWTLHLVVVRNIDLHVSQPMRGVMNRQLSGPAPDAGSVLKFVMSILRRSKWLIGGATVVAAAVAFALTPANTTQVWTGKTTLTIGMVPAVDYLLQSFGPPLAPIEGPRNAVARISDPEFRRQVVSRAAFEPATAAVSRPMVASSLRAIALDNDRDISVELSAGSDADLHAAFHAVAAEIDRAHNAILNRRLQLLQGRIDEAKGRIAAIEKATERANDRALGAATDDKNLSRFFVLGPATIPAWNNLQDRIQSDGNLKELSEQSVLHLDAAMSVLPPRPLTTLRFSLLAGFGMLIAMILLIIIVSPSARTSAD
jgi:hypothetical protein